jgi:hypothetical protein
MAMEFPYTADPKVDCVDFVTAADHNRQEAQLAGLTAQAPHTFNLPQFSLPDQDGVILSYFAIPAGKIVRRVILGIQQTDGSGPDADLVAKLTIGTHEIETDLDYEEFLLDPSESAGTVLIGTVENTTGSTKIVVGFVTLFIENA